MKLGVKGYAVFCLLPPSPLLFYLAHPRVIDCKKP